jgi:hypothetical protein
MSQDLQEIDKKRRLAESTGVVSWILIGLGVVFLLIGSISLGELAAG